MSLTPKTPIPEGAIRYNTDSNKMELWNGQKWMIVSTSSPNLNGGTRGMFHGGGTNPGSDVVGYNVIQMINISTAGNSTDFGDLVFARHSGSALASSTRAIHAGGRSGDNNYNSIDFTTIMSLGDHIDFGDGTQITVGACGLSNGHGGL